jgi:hypothetical protein
MKSIIGSLIWTAFIFIVCVIIFVILGTLLVFVLEFLGSKYKSTGLFYAAYFVAAGYNAIIFGSFSADKLSFTKSKSLKMTIIFLVSGLLSYLFIKVFYHFGQMQLPIYDDELLTYTVPGHEYITWFYFIVLTLASVFVCYINEDSKNITTSRVVPNFMQKKKLKNKEQLKQ